MTTLSESCASSGFEINPDMSFMELVEMCVMSKPRKKFREKGSNFGAYAHEARELKHKTIDGSTVYVFDGGYNGEVTVRTGKYFDHPTEGIRWDETHQATFYNQPYLLDILSRVR